MLRGGVNMLLLQNLILMGIFFTIPLYLQIVLGLDALETGVRMLPASVGLFVAAIVGSRLAARFPARTVVRAGLLITLVAALLLLDTIKPDLDTGPFLFAMGVLGVGMGLVVSQLGNVVQSAVGDKDRSEAGGIQITAQQLGSSFGTALLGAVVITGLVGAFSDNVAANPALSAEVRSQVEVQLSAGASFVSSDQVAATAADLGVDEASTAALVQDYGNAQLFSLKLAFLFAALLTLGALLSSGKLPTQRFDELQSGPDPPSGVEPEPQPA